LNPAPSFIRKRIKNLRAEIVISVIFLLQTCYFSVIFIVKLTWRFAPLALKQRRLTMKFLIGMAALCTAMAGSAQAQVQDRVLSADAPPQVLYEQIVGAATSMCREAADNGEVFNIHRCVEVVVDKTVAEVNSPSLTSYAQTTTPAEVAKRNA
jgi:hypothetical protein